MPSLSKKLRLNKTLNGDNILDKHRGEAVLLIAKIGGYLGRRNDPPPGHQRMWQGYTEFQYMCEGFLLQESG